MRMGLCAAEQVRKNNVPKQHNERQKMKKIQQQQQPQRGCVVLHHFGMHKNSVMKIQLDLNKRCNVVVGAGARKEL